METRWGELLTFVEVLLCAKYRARCLLYILSHSHEAWQVGIPAPIRAEDISVEGSKVTGMESREPPDFKIRLFCGGYWWNVKDIDQWNKTKHPEIGSDIPYALIFGKVVKLICRESVVFRTNGLEQLNIHVQKKRTWAHTSHFTQNQLKMDHTSTCEAYNCGTSRSKPRKIVYNS